MCGYGSTNDPDASFHHLAGDGTLRAREKGLRVFDIDEARLNPHRIRVWCKHYLFSNVHDMIPRDQFFGLFQKSPTSGYFAAFLPGIIFDKTTFCLGEKQGMLVNDECSSWCNRSRVGEFLGSVWDRRKGNLIWQWISMHDLAETPLQSAWPIALSAMMQFIYFTNINPPPHSHHAP